MSAEVLRRAAALMRERAESATRGPWNVDGPWWHDDDELGGHDETAMVTTYPARHAVAVMPPRDHNHLHNRDANARHIASWHPAAALAVAAWLEAEAEVRPTDMRQAWDPAWSHALAVARAYLGEQS